MTDQNEIQLLLDRFLLVSYIVGNWSARRCKYMMSGKPGKAKFVDEHILPDLRDKEWEALQKWIEALNQTLSNILAR